MQCRNNNLQEFIKAHIVSRFGFGNMSFASNFATQLLNICLFCEISPGVKGESFVGFTISYFFLSIPAPLYSSTVFYCCF